jgi:hypothetical protein
MKVGNTVYFLFCFFCHAEERSIAALYCSINWVKIIQAITGFILVYNVFLLLIVYLDVSFLSMTML